MALRLCSKNANARSAHRNGDVSFSASAAIAAAWKRRLPGGVVLQEGYSTVDVRRSTQVTLVAHNRTSCTASLRARGGITTCADVCFKENLEVHGLSRPRSETRVRLDLPVALRLVCQDGASGRAGTRLGARRPDRRGQRADRVGNGHEDQRARREKGRHRERTARARSARAKDKSTLDAHVSVWSVHGRRRFFQSRRRHRRIELSIGGAAPPPPSELERVAAAGTSSGAAFSSRCTALGAAPVLGSDSER